MFPLKFEYRILILYLFLGAAWILFSDQILLLLFNDVDVITVVQTYKGLFYVLVTGIFVFLVVRNHLLKLRNAESIIELHKLELEDKIKEKTKELDKAVIELSKNNETIQSQNEDLKSALEDLHATQNRLFQAEKLSSFAVLSSGLAHEINNPLNYIKGGVTGLNRVVKKYEVPSKECDLFVHSINEGISKVSSIVNQLGEMSKEDILENDILEVNTLLREMFEEIDNQGKMLIFHTEEMSHEPLYIKANAVQLRQVFNNIIDNAIESIDENGHITLLTMAENSKVKVLLSDNGCGIPTEQIKCVTDPFFTTKSPGKGVGLGLSLVSNILLKHKGSIQFKSEVNKGTTVEVVLPEYIKDE